MNINIKFLEKDLIGTTVPKPVSGTLSGHAAGEPFDKHVYKFIKKEYEKESFRQYEFLNKIYSDNPDVISAEDRRSLIKSPALVYLLSRGEEATKGWSPTNMFEEKQNDTADIMVVHENFFNIIDVKTFNASRRGQPPNIISAYKVAKMCALMLENRDFKSHDISYIGITWEVEGEKLTCTNVSIKELFKTDPSKLYINWTAAMQIQFHVEALSQSYNKSAEWWCIDYLHNFVNQARKRADDMTRKYIRPFEGFLKK